MFSFTIRGHLTNNNNNFYKILDSRNIPVAVAHMILTVPEIFQVLIHCLVNRDTFSLFGPNGLYLINTSFRYCILSLNNSGELTRSITLICVNLKDVVLPKLEHTYLQNVFYSSFRFKSISNVYTCVTFVKRSYAN